MVSKAPVCIYYVYCVFVNNYWFNDCLSKWLWYLFMNKRCLIKINHKWTVYVLFFRQPFQALWSQWNVHHLSSGLFIYMALLHSDNTASNSHRIDFTGDFETTEALGDMDKFIQNVTYKLYVCAFCYWLEAYSDEW